jgi:hypothetical protein
MRELTSAELEAVFGGATAIEYGIIAALVNPKALPGLIKAFGNQS